MVSRVPPGASQKGSSQASRPNRLPTRQGAMGPTLLQGAQAPSSGKGPASRTAPAHCPEPSPSITHTSPSMVVLLVTRS